jgi:hypothetical protein
MLDAALWLVCNLEAPEKQLSRGTYRLGELLPDLLHTQPARPRTDVGENHSAEQSGTATKVNHITTR